MFIDRHELLHLVQLAVPDGCSSVFLPVHHVLFQRGDQLGISNRGGCRAHGLHEVHVHLRLHGAHLQAFHVVRSLDLAAIVGQVAEPVFRQRQCSNTGGLTHVLVHLAHERALHEFPGHRRRSKKVGYLENLHRLVEAAQHRIVGQRHFERAVLHLFGHLQRPPKGIEEQPHFDLAATLELHIFLQRLHAKNLATLPVRGTDRELENRLGDHAARERQCQDSQQT